MADGNSFFDEASWANFESDSAPVISPEAEFLLPDDERQHDARAEENEENEERWDMEDQEMFVDPPSALSVPAPVSPSPYSSIAVPVPANSRSSRSGQGATLISPPAPANPASDSPRPDNPTPPDSDRTVPSSSSQPPPSASLTSSTVSTVAPSSVSTGTANAAASSSSAPPEPPQAAGPSNAGAAQASSVPADIQFPGDRPLSYYTATFPPGQNRPGFVPFGQQGQATVAQGNYWPIDLQLRSQIIRAETDANNLRPSQERLTYRQVLAKYSTWNGNGRMKLSTMRYHNRKFVNPIRDRVVKFHRDHLAALRRAVPRSRDARGRVAWHRVRDAVREDTDRLFGPATLAKRWKKMVQDGQGEGYDGPDVSDSDGGDDGDEDADE